MDVSCDKNQHKFLMPIFMRSVSNAVVRYYENATPFAQLKYSSVGDTECGIEEMNKISM